MGGSSVGTCRVSIRAMHAPLGSDTYPEHRLTAVRVGTGAQRVVLGAKSGGVDVDDYEWVLRYGTGFLNRL